jgi:hypothetical protein
MIKQHCTGGETRVRAGTSVDLGLSSGPEFPVLKFQALGIIVLNDSTCFFSCAGQNAGSVHRQTSTMFLESI